MNNGTTKPYHSNNYPPPAPSPLPSPLQKVMNHEFFRGLDWASLLAKRIPAPLNPCRNQRQGSESTHNFDPQFTRMPIDTMALGGGIVSPGPDGHFDGFTYEIPGVILENDR